MILERVKELPARHSAVEISILEEETLKAKLRMLSSLSNNLDVLFLFERRYGKPEVDVESKAYSWKFRINSSFYAELLLRRVSDAEEKPTALSLRTSQDAGIQEKHLIITHFLNVLTEESKSVWQKARERKLWESIQGQDLNNPE